MADIKWTFFADTAAAERAIQQLEQRNLKLENSLRQISKASKEAGNSFGPAIISKISGIASVATAFGLVTKAIREAGEAQRELSKVSSEIADKWDVSIRKIRILGNLTAIEGEAAKKSIGATAAKFGFSNAEGMEASKELTSAGFDIKEAIGPSLASLLKSLAANQEFGKDINTGDLARASASYLQSQGQALTGENLERIGVFVKKLADVSTVGIADLGEIAKHGSTLAGKMTQEEQFAAVTALRKEGMPGSEAANAVEKVVLSLTGKGDKKKTIEALKEMGLGTGDVDMVGESYTEVIRRLRKGYDTVPAERQSTALAKLIGVEHISAAKTLITKNDYVEQLTAGQNDRAGFDKAVADATEGRSSGGRRLAAIEEQQLEGMAPEYSDENYKSALRVVMRKHGNSEYNVKKSQEYFDEFRGEGFSQDTSLGLTPGTGGIPGIYQGGVHSEVVELLKQSVKSADQQTELLKTISGNKPTLNRNAQGESAP
jgi:TP901 family phage tail tape measure protein